MLIYALIDLTLKSIKAHIERKGWMLRPQFFIHHNIIYKEFTQKIWGRTSFFDIF